MIAHVKASDTVASLLRQTALLLMLTRTVQLLAVPVLVRWPVMHGLMSDDIHHQLGVVALALGLLAYRYRPRYLKIESRTLIPGNSKLET